MAEKITWKSFILPLVILIIFIGVIIGVVNWQRSRTEQDPTLSVNLPEEVIETLQEEATIDGETDRGNKVWINNESIQVSTDGKFSVVKDLKPGLNEFEIKAETKGGKSVSTKRTISQIRTVETTTTIPVSETSSLETPSALETPEENVIAGPAEDLTSSGPEDYLFPIAGLISIIWTLRFWTNSRKSVSNSLKNQ